MKCNQLIKSLMLMPLLVTLLGACGSGTGAGNGTNASTSAGSGSLAVALTDASTDQYQAVYVTVDEIQVNRAADGEETEAGWTTVGTPSATYNLLDLVNGTRESLGLADLEAGHYTHRRCRTASHLC